MRLKTIYNTLVIATILMLSSCSYVHEWPEVSSKVPFYIHLTYDTEMTLWEHTFDGTDLQETSKNTIVNNTRDYGKIRYIIRAYPISQSKSSTKHTAEFIFTQNITDGYNFETLIELEQDSYNIMVWSDLVETENDQHHYNADNFSNITLQGKEHHACTDYRDAFRGSATTSLKADVLDKEPTTLTIQMQRPLAKFEFISNDIQEFIKNETERIHKKTTAQIPNDINFENYNIIIYYIGFMPNAYSILTDKPTDSAAGILFKSKIQQISNEEASLGFDYVFIKPQTSAVTVQIAITNNDDEILSTSIPIQIPLERSFHTIIRGNFLTSETSGGVLINPDYDGEFNLVLP